MFTHCSIAVAVIHMKRKYWISGWILLPTPGRAGNGRLPTGAEYSSVHPLPPPTPPSPPPKNRSASCAPRRPLALKSSLLETFTFQLHPLEQLGQAGQAKRTQQKSAQIQIFWPKSCWALPNPCRNQLAGGSEETYSAVALE